MYQNKFQSSAFRESNCTLSPLLLFMKKSCRENRTPKLSPIVDHCSTLVTTKDYSVHRLVHIIHTTVHSVMLVTRHSHKGRIRDLFEFLLGNITKDTHL